MWIVYTLSALWSIGCAGAFIAGFRAVWSEHYGGFPWGAMLMLFGLGLPLCFIMGILPWSFIAYEQSPTLATLKKSEWVCTAEHPETTTTYIQSGKVMVPMTSTHMVCDQYGRI